MPVQFLQDYACDGCAQLWSMHSAERTICRSAATFGKPEGFLGDIFVPKIQELTDMLQYMFLLAFGPFHSWVPLSVLQTFRIASFVSFCFWGRVCFCNSPRFTDSQKPRVFRGSMVGERVKKTGQKRRLACFLGWLFFGFHHLPTPVVARSSLPSLLPFVFQRPAVTEVFSQNVVEVSVPRSGIGARSSLVWPRWSLDVRV